ncbi:MAG: hypothetical protein ACI8RD_010473 [Bacillariaceae sp.]|jgi:hypothetical protein
MVSLCVFASIYDDTNVHIKINSTVTTLISQFIVRQSIEQTKKKIKTQY